MGVIMLNGKKYGSAGAGGNMDAYAKKPYNLFLGAFAASSNRVFTINPDEFFIYPSGCTPSIQGNNCCGSEVNTLVARVIGIASVSQSTDNFIPFEMDIAVAHKVYGSDAVRINSNYIYNNGEKTSNYIQLYMPSSTSLRVSGDSKTYIQKIDLLR